MLRVLVPLTLAIAMQLNAQTAQRTPMRNAEISDVAILLRLSDTRQFDSTELSRILASRHPEVRRQAALALARIVDPRARQIIRSARGSTDSSFAATIVFATAQQYDTTAVPWLDSLLAASSTPPTVATEAARALGMIRTTESRAILARFLSTATAGPRTSGAIGEALLSLGRHTTRGDLAPIVRWTTHADTALRWRATWALFRPRDPAAVPHLLRLTQDVAPVVRNWAVRGLTVPQVDSAQVSAADVSLRLIQLVSDQDRTVRTQALRALFTHTDSASVATVARALTSNDIWMSVSAAEGLQRHTRFATLTVPMLTTATDADKPAALRTTALTALAALAQTEAAALAAAMATDTSEAVRNAAAGIAGRGRGGGGGGAGNRGGGAGGAGGATGRGRGAAPPARTMDDYRRIAEQRVAAPYMGAPRPRSEWTTVRGTFVIELYPAESPIGVDDFVKNVEAGIIVGTDFSRVVPDFVNQMRGIPGTVTLRDEVNRNRLARENVSWASAGLDTGRPGYTFGHTAQPHNEGSFTAVGRVASGMDVVDRINLWDRVLSTRMLPPQR